METATTSQELTRQMLHALGIPTKLVGYQFLCLGIPSFSQNDMQSMTKELYPLIGKQFGYVSWCGVERAIRSAISEAWEHGDPDVWNQYFPGCTKAPSNMVFITTLAEHLK